MNNGHSPIIAAIVAMAENRVIGKQNQLLWRLPADFKHFKATTMGHPILMGRKTYESIGKALPGRLNIVISRNQALKAPNCIIIGSLQEAIDYASKQDQQEIFIIGGEEIFKQSMILLDRIYLTIVHHEFKGDVFFPELKEQEWREVNREDHDTDTDNAYPYSFVLLERISVARTEM